MQPEHPLDITGILAAWSKGDENALAILMPLVYGDLRLIARRHIGRSPASAVQSGSLAHEVYVKLVAARRIRCNNRSHFFALCSQMMRRILVDHARKHGSAKRGKGLQVSLDEALLGELEALDEALNSLARIDPRKARVVELRFFGGLSVEEIADVLKISDETVTRDWRTAKTWLFREISHRG